MKILFIPPLSHSLTGHSAQVQARFDQLTANGRVLVLNSMSKDSFRQGISSLSRALGVLKIVWRTWRVNRFFFGSVHFIAATLLGNPNIRCMAARRRASQMENVGISSWGRHEF